MEKSQNQAEQPGKLASRIEITEYRAEILEDKDGNQFVAKFPDGVTRPVQYGAPVMTNQRHSVRLNDSESQRKLGSCNYDSFSGP